MKRIKIEARESTLLCDNRGKNNKLHCKMFENPKKPISYTVEDGKYRYVRHKPKKEGEWVELEPDREFDANSMQIVGPGTAIGRDKIGVASVMRLGGKPEKAKR